jgi:hypothetical protein
MVQIINRGPSIGQLLGEGLGAGASQTLTQRLQDKRQQKQMDEGLAKLDALGDIEDIDIMTLQKEIFSAFPGNPELAQKMMGNVLQQKLMEGKTQASQLAAEKAEAKEQRLIGAEERQVAKFEKEMADDAADIAFVKENYGKDVSTGKAARTLIAAKEKEQFEPTLQKGAAESILSTNKAIKERAESAKRVMPALRASRITNKKNVTGLGDIRTILFNLTGNEIFKTGDAALIDASVKELLGDLRKDIIGGRASQQEFLTMLGFVPGLGKTMSANENLFNFFITMKEMDLAEDSARRSYLDEIGGIGNAGANFESEIAERTEALRDGIWAAYQPVLHGKKDLFEQQIAKDSSLKKKQKVVSPDGNIGFIDKAKVKKAKNAGYYIYGK